jgi:hypothetical protein
MNQKLKFVLSLTLTSLCIVGIYLGFVEVQNSDLFVWGERTIPPRPWIFGAAGIGMILLPWSAGWTVVYLLRLIYPRRN